MRRGESPSPAGLHRVAMARETSGRLCSGSPIPMNTNVRSPGCRGPSASRGCCTTDYLVSQQVPARSPCWPWQRRERAAHGAAHLARDARGQRDPHRSMCTRYRRDRRCPEIRPAASCRPSASQRVRDNSVGGVEARMSRARGRLAPSAGAPACHNQGRWVWAQACSGFRKPRAAKLTGRGSQNADATARRLGRTRQSERQAGRGQRGGQGGARPRSRSPTHRTRGSRNGVRGSANSEMFRGVTARSKSVATRTL